jgi:Domain of unknown function (DUF4398)
MTFMRLTRRPMFALALATSLAVVAGCASVPEPTDKMAVAEAAILRASTSGTSADAARELQLATDKLTAARQAMNSKEYERAGQLAEQATVDAQAAEIHAQSARSRKASQETQDAARVLREEMNRKTVR